MLRRSAMVAVLVASPPGCGSRTLDESPVGEGTSASPATDSTGALDDTAAATTGSTGASATGASTGGDTCLPTVEIGPFTQLSQVEFGRMHVYDFDADGLADLVGRGGVIAYQRAQGFEQVASPEPIPSWCVPGRFDGDDTADLLFRISDHRLRLHLGGAAEPVVDTMIAQVSSLAPGDMDGDGIDDLVVSIDDAERIQTWRGSASGVFEMTYSLADPGLTDGMFASLEPPRVDLVVTTDASVEVLVADGVGGFTAAEALMWPYPSVDAVARAGDRDALAISWGFAQLETYTGVGLLLRDDRGALVGRTYDLAQRWPAGSAAADLDGDGALELVTGVSDPDGELVEVACASGEAYALCGATSIAHTPQWLALLPGPSGLRVVYSTSADGTWIASITATPCA